MSSLRNNHVTLRFLMTIISISVIFFSCKKIEQGKENKLVGTWKQEIPLAENPLIKEVWTFDENNYVLRIKYRSDTSMVDTGYFHVNSTTSRNYLIIENLDYYVNGTYIMLKQTKNMLLLQRVEAEYEAAFLRKEFTKE
ncbi:MAG: hypothetical protein ABIJ97_05885 [Bacteroidota bacterium]